MSVASPSAVDRYLRELGSVSPEHDLGNLRYYLEYLFDGVPLADRRVLDVGAGDGVYSAYAAAAGAERVVALEPESAGSSTGMGRRFQRTTERARLRAVQLVPETFQEFDPGDERFDVVLLHASINHLDEQACIALHRDEHARRIYREIFAKLAAISADGARLIVCDVTRHNLFGRLPVRNPVQPWIEWEKHQSPRLWARLLGEAGFADPHVRWSSFNTLRTPGRILLGNRVAAWFLMGAFRLTMTRTRRGFEGD